MIDWDWIGNGKVNRWNANYNLTLFLIAYFQQQSFELIIAKSKVKALYLPLT